MLFKCCYNVYSVHNTIRKENVTMPKFEKELKLTRVNVNLPTPLVEKVKAYSLKAGIPTTQGYIQLLTKSLDYLDALEYLPVVSELIKQMKSEKDTRS